MQFKKMGVRLRGNDNLLYLNVSRHSVSLSSHLSVLWPSVPLSIFEHILQNLKKLQKALRSAKTESRILITVMLAAIFQCSKTEDEWREEAKR